MIDPWIRGNLSTNPIEEFLKPEMTSKFVDSEYLRTVCIVVPKYVYLHSLTYCSFFNDMGETIQGLGE